MKVLLINIKKDIKSHFFKKGATPLLMTACMTAIACISVLAVVLLNSGLISFGVSEQGVNTAQFFSVENALNVYCLTALMVLPFVCPLALMESLYAELNMLAQMKLFDKGHRIGFLLLSKYLTAFLLTAFAFSIGCLILHIGLYASGLALSALNLLPVLNSLLLIFLISSLAVFSSSLDFNRVLRYLPAPFFAGVFFILVVFLKLSMTDILNMELTLASLKSLGISFLPFLCVLTAVFFFLISYVILKLNRTAKII